MTAEILTDDEHVVMLQDYVAKGSRNLDMVTSLVGKVIESGAWSHFTDQLGQPVDHPTFQSFVTTPHWKGLGTTKDALIGWVREQDESVAEQVERAWRGEIAPAKAVGSNQYTKVPRGASRATGPTQESDTADSILSRLKRDDPALAEQVVNGEVTPNAAALAKGWRKPRVLLTSPGSVATAIRRHWDDDQINELITALEGADQ